MMDLRVLNYFLTVAELGTVSAAAKKCYVSQPAVSRQIAAMEQELGGKLFERANTGLRLNAAGARFYPIAKDLWSRAEQATQYMTSLADDSLALVIACPPTTMDHLIAPFVAESGAPIADVIEAVPQNVYLHLENGEADLAVSTALPPSKYAVRKLVDVPITIQYRDGHPWLEPGSAVDLSSLQGEKLLMPGSGSAIHRRVTEAEVAQGLRLNVPKTVSSAIVAQSLSAAGLLIQGRPAMISLFSAWDSQHYAGHEIEILAERLRTWLITHAADIRSHSTPW